MMTTGEWESTSVGVVAALARGDSGSLASAFRVALETEEWIPPQRPLSEEMTRKSLLGVGLSVGECSKTSGEMN